MEITREKTLFFNFKETNLNPSELEIHRWPRGLGIQDGELKVIDYHYHTKHVVIKFVNQEDLDKFIEQNGDQVDYETNGITFEIPITIAGSKRKTVKVKFIPDELEVIEVIEVFKKYGKVNKFTWEEPNTIFPDLFKVKRERILVDMIINKNIPSFILVKGIKLSINYLGQTKTCSKCNETTHIAKNCTKDYMSYSSALKKQTPNKDNNIALALSGLEEIILEAEGLNQSNIQKKRRNSKESHEENTSDSEWKQIPKRGRRQKPSEHTNSLNNPQNKAKDTESSSDTSESESETDSISKTIVKNKKTRKGKLLRKIKM